MTSSLLAHGVGSLLIKGVHGILRLRELHAAMDRAVLDAYGWTDIPTDCDFFLDYEIDEETWGDKKKPSTPVAAAARAR